MFLKVINLPEIVELFTNMYLTKHTELVNY